MISIQDAWGGKPHASRQLRSSLSVCIEKGKKFPLRFLHCICVLVNLIYRQIKNSICMNLRNEFDKCLNIYQFKQICPQIK